MRTLKSARILLIISFSLFDIFQVDYGRSEQIARHGPGDRSRKSDALIVSIA
jgi:hypothetical protein